MKTKLILNSLVMVCSIASIIVLSSCGDDSSSSPTNYTSEDASSSSAKKTSVNTIYELGTCSYSNEDERIYVSGEMEYYICTYEGGTYNWEKDVPRQESSSSAINQTIGTPDNPESKYDNESSAFLYKAFSLEIDLTLFKQLSDNWEEYKSHKGNYSEGDPSISFIVKTYSDDELVDSVKTDTFKLDEDVGKWTGHQYFMLVFSGGVNEIDICPKVIERNAVESNVTHSLGYCYVIQDAGDKVNTPIMQNDGYATDYQLEWTTTISYK